MSNGDYIDLFITSCLTKGLSPFTVKWYSEILYKFRSSYPKLPRKPELIEKFLASCPGGDERRHGYYRTLRCFYRFLERRLRIKNPIEYIDPPRRSRKVPNTLSHIELNQLLSYPHEPTISASLLFLADTGARLGELHGLHPYNFKVTLYGYVAVLHGKTGARTVPVGLETARRIIRCLPFPYTKNRLGLKISQAFQDAGVRGTAHTLRHTFATLWEGSEIALQNIMGHADMETTKRYRHFKMQVLSMQHNQYTPVLFAGPNALQQIMI